MAASKHNANNWKTLGGRIAYLSRRMGMTVPELSIACDLSQPTLGAIANRSTGGKISGTEETYWKIVKYTDCDAAWLLFGKGQPFPGEEADPLDASLENAKGLPGEAEAFLREYQVRGNIEANRETWARVIGMIQRAMDLLPEPTEAVAEEEPEPETEPEPEPAPAPAQRTRPRAVPNPVPVPPKRRGRPVGRKSSKRPAARALASSKRRSAVAQPVRQPARKASGEQQGRIAVDAFAEVDRKDSKNRPLPQGVIRRPPRKAAAS